MKPITTKVNQVSLKELDITILESYVLSNRWNHEMPVPGRISGYVFLPVPSNAVLCRFHVLSICTTSSCIKYIPTSHLHYPTTSSIHFLIPIHTSIHTPSDSIAMALVLLDDVGRLRILSTGL
jgi:hypothetical protein